MKAKQRVTLVLAVNAAGTHMLQVALIGLAKQPLCFRSSPCPLPYFQQNNSWMNGEVFKAWVKKVFIPAVRARTSERVVFGGGKIVFTRDRGARPSGVHHPTARHHGYVPDARRGRDRDPQAEVQEDILAPPDGALRALRRCPSSNAGLFLAADEWARQTDGRWDDYTGGVGGNDAGAYRAVLAQGGLPARWCCRLASCTARGLPPA